MKAKLKDYYCRDIKDFDKNFSDSDNFNVSIQLFIGPEDEEGEESFEVNVCSPKWLLNNISEKEILFGKGLIISLDYNIERIIASVKKNISSFEGENWNEVAMKLSQIGYWEFENYNN